MSVEVCANLLKGHVETLEDDKFLNCDVEQVVGSYQQFLVSAGACTPRLKVSVVQKAAQEVFGGPPARAKAFAEHICDCFSYCRQKGVNSKTGVKLSEPVRQVVKAMFGTDKLQDPSLPSAKRTPSMAGSTRSASASTSSIAVVLPCDGSLASSHVSAKS